MSKKRKQPRGYVRSTTFEIPASVTDVQAFLREKLAEMLPRMEARLGIPLEVVERPIPGGTEIVVVPRRH